MAVSSRLRQTPSFDLRWPQSACYLHTYIQCRVCTVDRVPDIRCCSRPDTHSPVLHMYRTNNCALSSVLDARWPRTISQCVGRVREAKRLSLLTIHDIYWESHPQGFRALPPDSHSDRRTGHYWFPASDSVIHRVQVNAGNT